VKFPRILYFIDGPAPTDEQLRDISPLRNASFRNAVNVSSDERPEACDFVMGSVPPAYSHMPVWGGAKPSETEPEVPADIEPETAPADAGEEPEPESEPEPVRKGRKGRKGRR
jgi:hypothetical protein